MLSLYQADNWFIKIRFSIMQTGKLPKYFFYKENGFDNRMNSRLIATRKMEQNQNNSARLIYILNFKYFK